MSLLTETMKSYSKQFDDLRGCKDLEVLDHPLPKPSMESQAVTPGATRLPFSDVYIKVKQRPLLLAEPATMSTQTADMKARIMYAQRYFGIIGMHLTVLLAGPFLFSWRNLMIGYATWCITHLFGITFSYHRQLTHRSFKTPKWFEYLCAWLGCMAGQGDPIEWVSLLERPPTLASTVCRQCSTTAVQWHCGKQ